MDDYSQLGLIVAVALMFAALAASVYGVYFVVRLFFEGIRSASDQVEDYRRDARRKIERLNRFLADFVLLSAPERVVQELFLILWRDVLWAVDVSVTPDTPIERVYSPRWVDAGKYQSLEDELRRRCGVASRGAATSQAGTFGEIVRDTAADLAAGKLSDERILVRPAGPPSHATLLHPSEALPVTPSEVLLRPDQRVVNESKSKGRKHDC